MIGNDYATYVVSGSTTTCPVQLLTIGPVPGGHHASLSSDISVNESLRLLLRRTL